MGEIADHDRRVAWITGGTRGLGRAIALELARDFTVALSYRADDAAAGETRTAAMAVSGREPMLLRGDLADEEAAAQQAASILQRHGHIDAVVHCAAIAAFKPLLSLKPRELRRILAFSFESFHRVVLASADALRRTRGSIIAISSIGARRTIPGYGGLGAAKAALESYARHLAMELGEQQVRVNVISPGLLRTRSLRAIGVNQQHLAEAEKRTPLTRLSTGAEVASVARFLLSEQASAMTGQIVTVDGGYDIVA